jgi:DNA repair protein RadA/Sms
VDAVITLEGERYASLRILRTVKNRFGSTEEVGVFEMREDGLAEVADPARAFLAEHAGDAPGSVVVPTMEGTRPLLVEVQALVSPAGYGNPRRTASGLDPSRLALLIAVLARRAGVGLGTHDVYANVAGGLRVDEPAADLALAAALASSFRDVPIDRGTIAVGEVGLLGELRTVSGLERRLREAGRLGFRRAVVPRSGRGPLPAMDGIEVVAVASLRDALAALLGPEPAGRAAARQAGVPGPASRPMPGTGPRTAGGPDTDAESR